MFRKLEGNLAYKVVCNQGGLFSVMKNVNSSEDDFMSIYLLTFNGVMLR